MRAGELVAAAGVGDAADVPPSAFAAAAAAAAGPARGGLQAVDRQRWDPRREQGMHCL